MKYRISINEMATGKLPQGDPRWGTFNGSFVNQELEQMDIANAIYLGHAYTTWHEDWRNRDNFICGQHIAIDMDTDDERSSVDCLRQNELVRMYASMIHTTPSHTDESPRARIIFLLDEPITTASGYESATNCLMSFFDSDESCKDASRFFYGAKDCQIHLSQNILPVTHLRRLHRLWYATQPKPQLVRSNKIIKMPVHRTDKPDDDLQKVTEVLKTLSPWDMDYARWIGTIAALKREFGDTARELAITWAQGKPGEVEREWERLKVDRSKAMGLGTIFYMARSA